MGFSSVSSMNILHMYTYMATPVHTYICTYIRQAIVSHTAKESRINARIFKNTTTVTLYTYITVKLVNTPTETTLLH